MGSASNIERVPARSGGLLARMRIRKKLIFLHTLFSLALAGMLLAIVRPAIDRVVVRSELGEAKAFLDVLGAGSFEPGSRGGIERLRFDADAAPREWIEPARAAGGEPVEVEAAGAGVGAAVWDGRELRVVIARLDEARAAVARLYAITAGALLAAYFLVALSLEVFVLPRHVYGPIRRLLRADDAVQRGDRAEELIDPGTMPADELGEIMRSRNQSILALRRSEAELARALEQIEVVATDLKRKNHLLEAARRNLADADRLAGLGMMSAGIAHELNTPLAVIKGLAERLDRDPERGLDADSSALLLRVVGRLESLGESLLDYARVRPPRASLANVRALAEEAALMVRLDRGSKEGSSWIELENRAPAELAIECDGARLVQVLVNVIRNAFDAARARAREPVRVTIDAESRRRDDGSVWASITVSDNGPGFDPAILPRLFQPFASTRLDARGTGLGLAVAEGIVREHGGVILARNHPSRAGAIVEIMLPASSASTMAAP